MPAARLIGLAADVVAKMVASMRNRGPHSEETKEKMRQAHLNKRHTLGKMSDSHCHDQRLARPLGASSQCQLPSEGVNGSMPSMFVFWARERAPPIVAQPSAALFAVPHA